MNFFDSIKSRLNTGDHGAEEEEQFGRGIREGSWPEGVDDFKLMENTGTFLPNTPDVDPYAEYGAAEDNFSVVRSAATSRSDSRLRVIEGDTGRAKPEERLARNPFEDDGVQVIDRDESYAPRARAVGSSAKSYAERLRERVETVDTGLDQAFEPPSAVRMRPGEAADIDDELASRRVRRDAPRPLGELSGESTKPATMSADGLIIRARSYDDVRSIAAGLLNDHRPVVISTRACSEANAKRLLDVSFGMCCATGASIEELAPKLYAVIPRGASISDATMADLKRNGLLK